MQIRLMMGATANWKIIMNRLGYHENYDRRTNQISYIRRLRSLNYPRFHAYLEHGDQQATINLHLDEKAVSYSGQTRHSGVYDGELVEKEAERIQQSLQAYA
ncbi:MAG: hypothetical protein WC544_04210 [Patescibacteria group bacterium]